MTDPSQPAPPAATQAAMPEGEEQAPAGTRAMAIVRWGLVALVAAAAGGAWIHHLAAAGSARRAEGQWVCPMHPQILTSARGECPICGMDLVPVAAAPAPAPKASAATRYTCPMHPAFTTDDPNARCPECHMKLVPVKPREAGVPGLAPVDLSQERVQLMGMKTAVAAREPLGATLRAVGFVAASEAAMASVTARFAGFVETAPAQTGQRVEKGEVVATLYSPDLLAAQQAFLNAIRWTDRKAASGAAASSAEALERDAKQRLEQLGIGREDIENIASTGQVLRAFTLRAPVSGYVARKSVLRGAQVTAGQELYQIADLGTVWVLADVPENEVGRVRVGQRASFAVAAYPGERFSGRIQLVYPALNAGTRTLQARVELANRGMRLRPGMFGDVSLETGADAVVTVPAEALVDTGDHRYVFVDRGGGRFEPRAVRPGAARDGRVAVLEGLAEGERVVTTANFLLDSESRLRAAVEGGAAVDPPPTSAERQEPAAR